MLQLPCPQFLKDSEGRTRWELAFGREFLGPHYFLGQLGILSEPKMQESSSSAPMQNLLSLLDGVWTLG